MKKLILSLALTLFLGSTLYAQQSDSKFRVGIGGDFMLPVGNTSNYIAGSYGPTLQGEYKLTRKLSATLTASYIIVPPASLYSELMEPWYGYEFPNSFFYPVKGGLKYFVKGEFYASADAGVSYTKSEGSSTSFAYSGGIGKTFKVSSKGQIDLSARYETWALSLKSTSNFFGLRAIYSVGF